MVKNRIDQKLAEAVRLRDDAQMLLKRLLVERDQIEARLIEAGRRDPVKWVRGHSAMDDAIGAARSMVESMDRVLNGSATGVTPTPKPVKKPTATTGAMIA